MRPRSHSLRAVTFRQITPRHSGSKHVKDRIHDFAIVDPRTLSTLRQQRFEKRPFLIAQIKSFLIERDIPEIGAADAIYLRNAARKSNEVLRQLGADIQWVESYVAGNKLFSVYLAANEDLIRKHSEMSGFPATKIHKVNLKIDPTLASASIVGPIPIGHTP